MSLTSKDMNYLCALAKIQPSDEKLELYAGQCAKILDYMNELSQINTDNVEPLYSPVEHSTIYREDVPFSKRTREEILANAPLTDETYFIVPKIVEGK